MTDGFEHDDLGLDPVDAALTARLAESQPLGHDADTALARLRPRMVRARRRHRAALASVSALGLAAIVAVGALAVRPGGGVDIETPPATAPDRVPTSDATTSSSSSSSSSSSTTVPTLPTVPTVPITPDTTFTTPSVDDHGGSSGSGSSGSGSSGSGSSGSGSSGSGSSGSGG